MVYFTVKGNYDETPRIFLRPLVNRRASQRRLKRRQEEAFLRFCQIHELTPDKTFSDEGRSAFKGVNRKRRLGAFIAAAEADEYRPTPS